jgi:hypothetical protein
MIYLNPIDQTVLSCSNERTSTVNLRKWPDGAIARVCFCTLSERKMDHISVQTFSPSATMIGRKLADRV